MGEVGASCGRVTSGQIDLRIPKLLLNPSFEQMMGEFLRVQGRKAPHNTKSRLSAWNSEIVGRAEAALETIFHQQSSSSQG